MDSKVRAKKALGQHFLTDQSIARAIVDALGKIPDQVRNDATGVWNDATGVWNDATGVWNDNGAIRDDRLVIPRPERPSVSPVLEVGPGMGVLTQYLLEREDIDLKLVEIDGESVEYLLTHFPAIQGRLLQADFLRLPLEKYFQGHFRIIGNFPYNISSQIFFKVLDYRDQIPEVVGMVQKEVAERLAEGPGSKTYGILSVLLQAWYDIEYLFTVGSGAFAPPPKVQSAVIRLCRNGRTELGCDEALFKTIVKTSFGQRRKTLRNSLKPLLKARAEREGWDEAQAAAFTADPVFDLRPERLGVEDFVSLTRKVSGIWK